MRADAKKNYEQLLAIARDIVARQGAEASLRDIARKAGIGIGTLYRHFPTREALLEALLRRSFDTLREKAENLETADDPDTALIAWLHEIVDVAQRFSGAISAMVSAISDEESALHASCVTMRAAGTRLLVRAQETGTARKDMTGVDLFALVSALAWLGDQPTFAARNAHLFDLIAGSVLTDRVPPAITKFRAQQP